MSLLRHFDRRPRSPRTLKWVTWPVAAALVAAFPVATWWVVGDLSTVPASARPDFAFRPFTFSHGIILAAGIGSVSLTVLTLTWLTWATVGRRFDARWWTVIVPLLAAGFIAGAGWRVMTAGVIGANIGAGMVVVIGGPVVAALLGWALARSIRLLRRSTGSGPQARLRVGAR